MALKFPSRLREGSGVGRAKRAAAGAGPTPLRLANKFASLAAPPACGRGGSQDPLGRGNRVALAWVDLDRLAQRSGKRLVHAFGDMMVVLAVEHLDVQRDPRGLR